MCTQVRENPVGVADQTSGPEKNFLHVDVVVGDNALPCEDSRSVSLPRCLPHPWRRHPGFVPTLDLTAELVDYQEGGGVLVGVRTFFLFLFCLFWHSAQMWRVGRHLPQAGELLGCVTVVTTFQERLAEYGMGSAVNWRGPGYRAKSMSLSLFYESDTSVSYLSAHASYLL